jgi:hypothetical protein
MPVKIRFALLAVLLALMTLFSACGDGEPNPNDRETFPEETYIEAADASVSFRADLKADDYPEGTVAGNWLVRCGASDRNDQFDAYTLRHESVSGDKTAFTYLIYYPHGGNALTPAPEVLEGGSGFVVNLTYKAGGSTEGYSLCALTVTLPTDKAPRLRLLYEGEVLGQMATVSDEEIGA